MDNLNDIFAMVPYAPHDVINTLERMKQMGFDDYVSTEVFQGFEGITSPFISCEGITEKEIAPAPVERGYIRHVVGNYVPSPGLIPLTEIEKAFASTIYTPKRIIRNGPATIVFWANDTKTIVKCAPDEEDNAYAAFTAALAIKIFGSNSKLKKIVKTFTEVEK